MNHRRRKGTAIRAITMNHQQTGKDDQRRTHRIGFGSNKYVPFQTKPSRDLLHVLALELPQLST